MGFNEEKINKIIYKENKGESETPISTDFQKINQQKIKDFEKENELILFQNVKPIDEIQKKVDSKKPIFAKIEDIYFQPEFTSEEFQTTFRLLAEAERYSKRAKELFEKGDLIGSDDAIHHLQALLPELFCCRDLSKSLGSIVNAIQNALLNNKGLPLPKKKIVALQKIISELRNQPFMKFDKAIDLIMDFEDAEFIIQPLGFEYLAEILDEQK